MWFRFLPPARSPLSAAAIVAATVVARDAAGARRALVRELEERYEGFTATLTDGGTNALRLAIGVLAGQRARPVAVPAFGCFDLATAVDGAGVPFVLYDIDPGTLAPDLPSLERALEAGADRIVVAHLYGLPVDADRIRAVAARYGARVVDDAAQGIGATWAGRPLGTTGDAGVLSFGRGKGVTGGKGGALLLPFGSTGTPSTPAGVGPGASVPLAELLALGAQWALGRPALYAIPASLPFLGLGETHYRPPHPVTEPSGLAAALVRRSLAAAAPEAERRRANAARLAEAARARGYSTPAVAQRGVPGYLRLPLLVPADVARAVAAGRARRLGVMPSYPRSLADLDGFGERRLNRDQRFPGAQVLAERLVTLPTHGALLPADLRALERWIAG